MSEIEPFDWTSEVGLGQRIEPSTRQVLQYAQAVSLVRVVPCTGPAYDNRSAFFHASGRHFGHTPNPVCGNGLTGISLLESKRNEYLGPAKGSVRQLQHAEPGDLGMPVPNGSLIISRSYSAIWLLSVQRMSASISRWTPIQHA